MAVTYLAPETLRSLQCFWVRLLLHVGAEYEDVDSITLDLRNNKYEVEFKLPNGDYTYPFSLDEFTNTAKKLFTGAREVVLYKSVTSDYSEIQRAERTYQCSFINIEKSYHDRRWVYGLPYFVKTKMCDSVAKKLGRVAEKPVKVKKLAYALNDNGSVDVVKYSNGSVILYAYTRLRELLCVVVLGKNLDMEKYITLQGATETLHAITDIVNALKNRTWKTKLLDWSTWQGSLDSHAYIYMDDFCYATGVFDGGEGVRLQTLEERAESKNNTLKAAVRRLKIYRKWEEYKTFVM